MHNARVGSNPPQNGGKYLNLSELTAGTELAGPLQLLIQPELCMIVQVLQAATRFERRRKLLKERGKLRDGHVGRIVVGGLVVARSIAVGQSLFPSVRQVLLPVIEIAVEV